MAHGPARGAAASFRRYGVPNDPRLFAPAGNPVGRAWIAGLPALVATLRERWGLAVELRSENGPLASVGARREAVEPEEAHVVARRPLER